MCGIQASLGAVILLCISLSITALHIEYDRDSYRAELLAVIAGLDLFVLGVGHLWDTQLSIKTVVNCRIIYCCCILATVAVVYSSQGGFGIEFSDVQ